MNSECARGPLSGGPNQWNHLQIPGQPAVECWQPLFGIGREIWGLRLSLPDGLLPWLYSDPQDWKQCCCVLWLFAAPGPVMQRLIAQVFCDIDASKLKSRHNIWFCIEAVVRPARCNLTCWTGSRSLSSNREQNRNKIDSEQPSRGAERTENIDFSKLNLKTHLFSLAFMYCSIIMWFS